MRTQHRGTYGQWRVVLLTTSQVGGDTGVNGEVDGGVT